MLGLGAYESSSEDEVETKAPSSVPQRGKEPPVVASPADQTQEKPPANHIVDTPQPSVRAKEVPDGPVLGPTSLETVPTSTNEHATGGPSSPFSASRALIQDLTLPPVPNLDIPPSPPGSPEPAANTKFEHFLSLKKQGVHFNSKLASSSSLKNPSLLMKMMEHAGINEQSQYDTALPAELWDTSNLPKWGFKEELLKTQQEARQRMEEEQSSGQRASIEFISGSSTGAERSGPRHGPDSKRNAI